MINMGNPMDRLAQLNEAMDKYKATNNDFFTLTNDKDLATVRFMYENAQQLDWFVVHEVQLGGKKRWLLCPETPECPCCQRNGRPQIKLFLQLLDHRDNKMKTFERGQKFIPKILALFENYGSLVNLPCDIQREGKAGDTSTDYTIYPHQRDNATVEALKQAGYERQVFVGPDGFIMQKSIDEMWQIVNGTFQFQRVENPAARQGGAPSGAFGGGFGGGPSFGGAPSSGGGYGSAPQTGYGGSAPSGVGYGAPQPGYGTQQPGYGAPQPNFGTPQPNFGGAPQHHQGNVPRQWDNAPQQSAQAQPIQQQSAQPSQQQSAQTQQWGAQEQQSQWGQNPAGNNRPSDVF